MFAVQFAPEVVVHNNGALPDEWTGRFDMVVLCRSLWGRDYMRVLMECLPASRRACMHADFFYVFLFVCLSYTHRHTYKHRHTQTDTFCPASAKRLVVNCACVRP